MLQLRPVCHEDMHRCLPAEKGPLHALHVMGTLLTVAVSDGAG